MTRCSGAAGGAGGARGSDTGYPPPRRDNLEVAQQTIARLAADQTVNTSLDGASDLEIAVARALIDIARSLRSIEGYLCNHATR